MKVYYLQGVVEEDVLGLRGLVGKLLGLQFFLGLVVKYYVYGVVVEELLGFENHPAALGLDQGASERAVGSN